MRNPLAHERKALLPMMPRTAQDVDAAMRIVQLGYPAVAPVLGDMIQAMGVAESPVADAFAAFFAQLGRPGADAISRGLSREDCSLRHRIFTQVLPQWHPELLRGRRGEAETAHRSRCMDLASVTLYAPFIPVATRNAIQAAVRYLCHGGGRPLQRGGSRRSIAETAGADAAWPAPFRSPAACGTPPACKDHTLEFADCSKAADSPQRPFF